jgi:hypothetical protein
MGCFGLPVFMGILLSAKEITHDNIGHIHLLFIYETLH